MSRTYNELGLLYSNAGYDYSGVTTFTSTAIDGAGTGSSTSSRVITRLRTATASGDGTSGSSNTVTSAIRRTANGDNTSGGSTVTFVSKGSEATGSGLGSSTSVRLRSVVRDNQEGNGYGAQNATGLHTRIVVCTGAGVGTQSASWLRTRIVNASGSALGTSSVIYVRVSFRTASSTSVSAETGIKVVTAIRTSTSTGSGGTDVATWLNLGKTLNGKVMMSPIRANKNPYLIRRR